MPTSLDTTVQVSRSQESIRTILRRNNCLQMLFGDDFEHGNIFVFFKMAVEDPKHGPAFLPIKIPVHLEIVVEALQEAHPQKYAGEIGLKQAWDQAAKVAYRNMHDWLKATFTAIEVGIITMTEAFLADIVTENGFTVGERLLPNLPDMLHKGKTLPLLEAGGK